MHASVLTEPGLQAGDRPVLFLHCGRVATRSMQYCPRVSIILGQVRTVVLCALAPVAVGCSSKPVLAPPAAPVATPIPTPPSSVAIPALARLSIAGTVGARQYAVQTRTRVERDSAGRKEEQLVVSQGIVTLALQRASDGALRGTGRVDSFTVQISGAGAPPGAPSTAVPPSVQFDAVLDAERVLVMTRPPLANECDRPEVGATALARDILVRVPAMVSAGDRWRDSTASFFCRVGIPITVYSRNEYVVERIDGALPLATVLIRRTTNIRLEGKRASPWRALEISGAGSGHDEFRIDAITGTLLLLDGASTVTLDMTDRSKPATPRTQRVQQNFTVHVVRRN